MTGCPECASQRVWKDGLRHTRHGDVQRWLCRNCGFRFSGVKQDSVPELQIKKNIVPQSVEKFHSRPNFAQIPVRHVGFAAKKTLDDSAFPFGEDVGSHTNPHGSTIGKDINAFASTTVNTKYASRKRAKNLVATAQTEQRDAGATKSTRSKVQGRMIEFVWFMQKQGYAESTVKNRMKVLQRFVKIGVNLYDPESVKGLLANQRMYIPDLKKEWSTGYKCNIVDTYTSFLNMQGLNWNPPKYKRPD